MRSCWDTLLILLNRQFCIFFNWNLVGILAFPIVDCCVVGPKGSLAFFLIPKPLVCRILLIHINLGIKWFDTWMISERKKSENSIAYYFTTETETEDNFIIVIIIILPLYPYEWEVLGELSYFWLAFPIFRSIFFGPEYVGLSPSMFLLLSLLLLYHSFLGLLTDLFFIVFASYIFLVIMATCYPLYVMKPC